MEIKLTKYGKVPYGTKITMETKEEAIERVYEQLKKSEGHFFFDDGYYSANNRLYIINGHLCFYPYYVPNADKKYHFCDANSLKNEDPEVLEIVEARVIKEIQEYEATEKARLKAEAEAEQARKDAAMKAKYLSWKAEAERLDIPFRDLCDMKRAEMEAEFEDRYWDDDDD